MANATAGAALGALAASNPYLAAASTVLGLLQSHKAKSQYNKSLMSYDTALGRAKAQINPQYASNLQRALSALNVGAASRGVSGQDRTNAQMASLTSQSEADRSSAAAQLAQQIMAQNNQQAATNYNLEQGYNQNQSSDINSILNALSGLTTQKGGYSYPTTNTSTNSNTNFANSFGVNLTSYNPNKSNQDWINELNKKFRYHHVQ
jgi:hypothetical protein